MLNISAFLLSQKRLNEVLSSAILPPATRMFTISDPKNAGLDRTAVISDYETAALAWLSDRKFPPLGELITENRLAPGLFFIHDGPFFGREIEDSAIQFQEKGYTSKKPVLWTKLDTFREGLKLTIQAHPENYTTKSAPGEMAGKNHLFLAARITEVEENEIRAQAYIVGRLHEELRPEAPSVDRFNRLPWKMEIFPLQIDQFGAGAMEATPTSSELALLKTIPEDQVKNAFAELLGEPFVPRDWGGERSDLVTSNLSIEGERIVAAFAFKGKSVPRPLTIAAMGINGDQGGRLFAEISDLVVVQHCAQITSAVRDLLRAYAVRPGQIKPFCLLDGAETIRVLRAYGKLGFTSRRTIARAKTEFTDELDGQKN